MEAELILVIVSVASTTFAISTKMFLKIYESKQKLILKELEDLKNEIFYIKKRIDNTSSNLKELGERISRIEGYINNIKFKNNKNN